MTTLPVEVGLLSVQHFVEEHAGILLALQVIRESGIGSPEGMEALRRLESRLLDHVEREEQEVYAPLRRRATTEPKLRRTLELFADDLEDVTRTVLAFFDRYRGGDPDDELPGRFGEMAATLKARVRMEETVLFQQCAAAGE